MELKLGKMTNGELAKWFGIGERTFRNNKSKKLEILKDFADFHEEKGKIIIDRIYESVYTKPSNSIYPRVKELVPKTWSKNGLDTSSHVSNQIYKKVVEEGYTQQKTTVYNYTTKAKRELYGKAFTNGGTLGTCVIEYSKAGPNGKPIEFTEEERKIYKSITKQFYGEGADDKIAFIMEMNATYNFEEMSKEDLVKWNQLVTAILSNGHSYMDWKQAIETALGVKLIRSTRIQPKGLDWSDKD